MLAALMICGASLAQDAPKQTPENAQLFVTTVARQHGLGIEIMTPNGYNVGTWSGSYRRERAVSGYYSMSAFKSQSVAGVGCTTTFFWDVDNSASLYDSTYGNIRHGDMFNGAFASEISDLKDRNELEIDWTKVAGINRSEYSTQIELVGFGRVTAPTVELATRLQFAMEFLRNACDPTAATGF